MYRPLIALSAFLVACSDGAPSTDTNTDDTGDSPPIVDGCFSNADGGVFVTLQEAIDDATEGDTIILCEGLITEAVVITKDLSLEGAGAKKTSWSVTTDEDGVAINAEANIIVQGGANLNVSGITIESTRSGIRAEGSSVVLNDMVFKSPGTYGVYGSDSSITVSASTFRKAEKGGLYVDGGAVTATDCLFDRNFSFGVRGEANAVVSISNSEFTETRSKSGSDGFDIWFANGSVLTSESNLFTDTYDSAFYGESALIFSSINDQISGSESAYIIENSPGTISNVQITDIFKFGISTDSSGDLTIEGMELITDPETSKQSTSNADGSIGIYAVDTNLDISNSTISGHNGYGLFAVKQYLTEMNLDVTSVEFDNNARLSLQLEGIDTTLTDVNVTNTRSSETCITTDGQYWCNFGVRSYDSTLTWSGGLLEDNEMYGMVSFVGAAIIDDIDVINNGTIGLYVQDGAMSISNTDFYDGKSASVAAYSGSFAELENVNFFNGKHQSVYESVDGNGDTVTTVYHHQGLDIVASDATMSISNATFSGGDRSISAYDSELTIEDAQWDEYNENAVYAYAPGGAVTSIKRSTMNGIGAYGIFCSYATMDLERITITNMHEREYWYETYLNGALTSETTASYSSPAVYASYCSLTADNLSVRNSLDQAIYAYNSSANLTDITIANVNQNTYTYEGAIDLYNYSVSPNFFLKGINVADVSIGNAIRIEGNAGYPGGNVELSDLSLGVGNPLSADKAIGHAGLYLDTLDTVSIDGFEIDNVGAEGIVFEATTATVIGSNSAFSGNIINPVTDGIYVWGGSNITLSDVTVKNAGVHGAEVQLSTLNASNFTVDGAMDACLSLNGGEQSFDTSSSMLSCGTYGMECTNSPIIDQCPDTLDGLSGSQSECGTCNQ